MHLQGHPDICTKSKSFGSIFGVFIYRIFFECESSTEMNHLELKCIQRKYIRLCDCALVFCAYALTLWFVSFHLKIWNLFGDYPWKLKLFHKYCSKARWSSRAIQNIWPTGRANILECLCDFLVERKSNTFFSITAVSLFPVWECLHLLEKKKHPKFLCVEIKYERIWWIKCSASFGKFYAKMKMLLNWFAFTFFVGVRKLKSIFIGSAKWNMQSKNNIICIHKIYFWSFHNKKENLLQILELCNWNIIHTCNIESKCYFKIWIIYQQK